jgi:hypothetical protein
MTRWGTMRVVLGLALLVAFFQEGNVRGEGPERSEDPDLPAFLQGKAFDKEAFMHARDEYIAELRGVPHFLKYNPRLRALHELEEQERRIPQIDPAFWTQIGPAPIPNGQTNPPPNPVSGRTVAIAIHPTNPDIVYVGAAQGGVYRSLDGGQTWTPIFDNAMSLAIGALALAPSNPSILYVGTGEPSGSADGFFGVGLYRIDNADTTADLTGPIDPPVNTPIPGTTTFTGRAISEILVHPTNDDIVFVATFSGTSGNPSGGSVGFTIPPLAIRGVYRSTNATTASPTFTKLNVFPGGGASNDLSVGDIVMDPGDPNNVVAWVLGAAAAGEGGLYRSTDALGATPTFTQLVTTLTANVRGELAAQRVGGVTNMWAATGETASQGAVRRSTDGGATWSAPLAGGVGFCSPQCFYDIAVAAHPTTAGTLMLGGSPTLVSAISTNFGDSFTLHAAGLHVDTHVIAYAPSNPSIAYFGSDGGIWRSSDSGNTWTARNNTSYHATQFQSGAIHPLDPEYFIGGTQDNGTEFRRPDTTWFHTDGGDGGYALIDQSAADTTTVTMYHTYFNQTSAMAFTRVLTTADANSGNWAPLFGCGFGGSTPNGISCPASNVLFYAPMALGPGTPNTVYFGSDRLYRSADRGVTMPTVSQVLINGQAITTIAIAPTDDNVRIAGTRNGHVFATTTGSNVLADITAPGMPPPNPSDPNARRAVARAKIDPTNANVAYVTFGGYTVPAGQHVWKTTNLAGGAGSWVASGNGIPDVPVNAFVIDPANTQILYAGTDIGVFASTDGGANWVPYTTGMPRVTVFDLTLFNGTTRVLRAATHGRGIWERTPLPVPVSLQSFEVK